jgi:hypothetical protein
MDYIANAGGDFWTSKQTLPMFELIRLEAARAIGRAMEAVLREIELVLREIESLRETAAAMLLAVA